MTLIAIYNDIEYEVCEEDRLVHNKQGFVVFRKIYLENADASEVIYNAACTQAT